MQKHEQQNHDHAECEADEGRRTDGHDDDVARKPDLAQQVRPADERRDSPIRGLGEEAPDDDAEEQVDRVVRDRRPYLQQLDEHHVQDREQRERSEQRPHVSENRRLIAELEVGD